MESWNWTLHHPERGRDRGGREKLKTEGLIFLSKKTNRAGGKRKGMKKKI